MNVSLISKQKKIRHWIDSSFHWGAPRAILVCSRYHPLKPYNYNKKIINIYSDLFLTKEILFIVSKDTSKQGTKDNILIQG